MVLDDEHESRGSLRGGLKIAIRPGLIVTGFFSGRECSATMTRVYVGNLDPRVSDRDLEDEFRMFGVLRRLEKPSIYILFMPIILALNELLILMHLMAVFGLLGDHQDMPLLNLTITGML